jgi:hypothetical protein
MGSTSSKTQTTQIMNLITDIVSQDVMQCPLSINSTQSISQTGNNDVLSGASQTFSGTINMTCYQTMRNVNDLTTSIQNQVQQMVTAKNSGFNVNAGTYSSAATNMNEAITNTITMQSISNCAASVNASQSIVQAGNADLATQIAQTQTATAFANCYSQMLNNSSLSNAVNNFVTQNTAATTENPLTSWLTSIFSSITDSIMFVVGGIILFIIVIVMMRRGSSSSDNAGDNAGDNTDDTDADAADASPLMPPPRKSDLSASMVAATPQTPYSELSAPVLTPSVPVAVASVATTEESSPLIVEAAPASPTSTNPFE